MNWLGKLARFRLANWDQLVTVLLISFFAYLQNSPNTIASGLAGRNQPPPYGPWRFWTTVLLSIPIAIVVITLISLGTFNFLFSPAARQKPRFHWSTIILMALAVPALILVIFGGSKAVEGYALLMMMLIIFSNPFLIRSRARSSHPGVVPDEQ